jgi:site-specific DNA-methyltransferase (adenine-specific)
MKINNNIEITNEDNMLLMARYPDNYFDLAIVDPPYGIDDKLYRSSHGKNKNSAIAKFYKADNRWDIAPNKEYFTELFRVSKNQIIWGGNYFYLPTSRGYICWDKIRPPENSFSDFELAWSSFDKMPKMFRFGANGGFVAKKEDRIKIHPTQKPIQLYRWLLLNYAENGYKILDTHLGSGSIVIALDDVNKIEKMNLTLTACEIDTEYFESTTQRINEQTNWTSLF